MVPAPAENGTPPGTSRTAAATMVWEPSGGVCRREGRGAFYRINHGQERGRGVTRDRERIRIRQAVIIKRFECAEQLTAEMVTKDEAGGRGELWHRPPQAALDAR
jgi:hypothetical protein